MIEFRDLNVIQRSFIQQAVRTAGDRGKVHAYMVRPPHMVVVFIFACGSDPASTIWMWDEGKWRPTPFRLGDNFREMLGKFLRGWKSDAFLRAEGDKRSRYAIIRELVEGAEEVHIPDPLPEGGAS
jgi:hypothetical protein